MGCTLDASPAAPPPHRGVSNAEYRAFMAFAAAARRGTTAADAAAGGSAAADVTVARPDDSALEAATLDAGAVERLCLSWLLLRPAGAALLARFRALRTLELDEAEPLLARDAIAGLSLLTTLSVTSHSMEAG